MRATVNCVDMPWRAPAALWSALCCGEGATSAMPSLVFLSATAACIVHVVGAGYAFRRIGSRFFLREIVLGLLINHVLGIWLWTLSILEQVSTTLCSHVGPVLLGSEFLASMMQPKLVTMVVCSAVSIVPVYFLTELTDNTNAGFFVWVHGPRWNRTEMGASTYFLARPPDSQLPDAQPAPSRPRSLTDLPSKPILRRVHRRRVTRSI